jgi:autotransporter translocation and assembly factor TamB
MSDVPSSDLLAQLQAQLAAVQKPIGWNTPAVTTPVQGIAVPIKVTTPKGDIRLYLQLPAECAAGPEVIMQTLQSLDSQGYPLDVWQSKSSWGNKGGWRR